ncbi:MAG: protein-L-isoaspartate(D-aspartate) O-methyltransferase [Oceanicaulis sp.]
MQPARRRHRDNDVFTDQRSAMVSFHLAGRDVKTPSVLKAMEQTPREHFVPEDMAEFAYSDSALPIEAEQTISQPYIVAKMIELAEITPGDTVLEVGAGSGYAAAVMSHIAGKVYAIERHAALADSARKRLEDLDYGNVEIVCGDGTRGLPKSAPYDAIVVSAGGELPDALTRQLKVGGRLVIPLDMEDGEQVLTVLRRIDEERLEVTDHGLVRFVPLVAEAASEQAGEAEPGLEQERVSQPRRSAAAAVISEHAEPFDDFDDLADLCERFADKRVVCLGESTHGTSEFYAARAAITERLVRDHGFTIVAVEADWPDAAYYDHAIRDGADGQPAEDPFTRFPRWMWRNEETWDLLKRLRDLNHGRDVEKQAGFYGLDVYSLSSSLDAVLRFLREKDPEAEKIARERYACLAPYASDPAAYGRMRLNDGYEACEDSVISVLRDQLSKSLDGEALFDAEQNARIVAAAEEYYRIMYYGGAESWNLRDTHMADTLDHLLERRGPDSKAVVWAHNSHLGDARATEMGWARREHNLGQLIRERHGADTALIGFSTNAGEVAAADDWDGPMQVKAVRPGLEGSIEAEAVQSGQPRFFLDMNALSTAARSVMTEPRLQRAIGVIYRPQTELQSHYLHADLARQFDAWVWFETTRPVAASQKDPDPGARETFPFAV